MSGRDGVDAFDAIGVRYEAPGTYLCRVPGSRAPGSHPAILAVHGYAQLPEHLLRYVCRAAPDATVLVPRGPSTFRRPSGRAAHVWIASRDRAIEDARNDAFLDAVVSDAATRGVVDPDRLVVLAYSQGVGVGLHWWSGRPGAARAFVGLAGGFAEAYRERLKRLAGRPVLWVTGAQDDGYPVPYTNALLDAMRDARVEVEAVSLDAGHDLLEPAFERVCAWISAEGPSDQHL